jgi:hypothetical protein
MHPFAGSVYGERDAATEPARGPGAGEIGVQVEDRELPANGRAVVSHGSSAPVAKAHAPESPTRPAQAPAPEPTAFLPDYEPLQPRRLQPEAHRAGSAASTNPAHGHLEAFRTHNSQRADQTRSETPGAVRPLLARENPEGARAFTSADATAGEGAKSREATLARGEPIPRERARPMASARQLAQPIRQPSLPPREAARNIGKEDPDVQVHIGRIEVLAVQQQAPATPAPRRERTTSLADYMAGRNGRGR